MTQLPKTSQNTYDCNLGLSHRFIEHSPIITLAWLAPLVCLLSLPFATLRGNRVRVAERAAITTDLAERAKVNRIAHHNKQQAAAAKTGKATAPVSTKSEATDAQPTKPASSTQSESQRPSANKHSKGPK
jgi:hypothetical protein